MLCSYVFICERTLKSTPAIQEHLKAPAYPDDKRLGTLSVRDKTAARKQVKVWSGWQSGGFCANVKH